MPKRDSAADHDQEVGRRLKALRERRKLSLRALTRQTGIATSFLSSLEAGRTTVSVAKLKTIVDALGSGLGEFFSSTIQPPAKVVYRESELVEISGQAKGLSFLEVAASRPGRALQLLRETYDPGSDTGPEWLRHEAEEAGIVLKGQLELTVDGTVHLLAAGDAYYFDSRLPHRFRNTGKTVVEAISVNSPPSF
jgi:transcriptional regulator with XRE-family HTH domain